MFYVNNYLFLTPLTGRYGSVGIAVRCGLDGQGDRIQVGVNVQHPSRPALGPTPLSIL